MAYGEGGESKDVVKSVEQCFKRAEEAQSQDFQRLEKYFQLYRSTPSQSMYNIVTRSQYVVPLCFKTVETVAPRIVSVLLSTSPPIQSRYRTYGDPEKLRTLDQMFAYLMDQKGGFPILVSAVKTSLIYGQSYVKVGWKQKKRTRMVKVPTMGETGEMMDEEQEVEEVIEDGLDLQNVSPFELYFDPEAHFPFPFKSAKWVIHAVRKRKSQILAMRDAGIYLPFDDKDITQEQDDASVDKKLRNAIQRSVSYEEDRDDPMVDIYEYWEDEKLCVTANHRVLLREEGNPFGLPGRPKKKPFVAFYDQLVDGTLWQIGEVEPLEHVQIEMSTLRRQRTDVNSLIINPMYIYNKDADVDLEAFELSRPGGGIGCRPVDGSISNAIQQLPRGDLNGASYREFEALDKDAQETSGMLDYAVGQSPERRETATTVQLLQSAANLRFDIKIRGYSDSTQELGYMCFERWSQLQTTPVPLRIPVPGMLEPTYKNVTKEDFPPYDDVELIVPGSPDMLLKDARQQKLQQHAQTLLSLAAAPPSPLVQAAIELEKIALQEADISGVEPVLRLLEAPPPMPMMPGMESALPPEGVTGNGEIPKPPQPVQPSGLNENPITFPGPHPNN